VPALLELEGLIGRFDPADVRDVLAQRQTAVDLGASGDLVGRVEVVDALRAFLEPGSGLNCVL
jgi:hypothetical protein